MFCICFVYINLLPNLSKTFQTKNLNKPYKPTNKHIFMLNNLIDKEAIEVTPKSSFVKAIYEIKK